MLLIILLSLNQETLTGYLLPTTAVFLSSLGLFSFGSIISPVPPVAYFFSPLTSPQFPLTPYESVGEEQISLYLQGALAGLIIK